MSRRMPKSEQIDKWDAYVDSVKDVIVVEGTNTEVGGNLEVDGTVKVNSFKNITSKAGESHWSESFSGDDEDIEVVDMAGENGVVKLVIKDTEALTVYEYAYNDLLIGWVKIASAGDTEKFDDYVSTDGSILSISAGYGTEIKAFVFVDSIATL